MPPRRNPYAARLEEFSSFAFSDQETHKLKGAWRAFFNGRSGLPPVKLVFEIGCSNGIFLASAAADSPHYAFVGIDWKFKAVYKAARRVANDRLQNVAVLRGLAQDVSKIFGEGEVDEIWIFFPDPWAKTRQLKHRLIQEPFLLEAARVLNRGGKIQIKTDHPGYFQWILAVMGAPQPELTAKDLYAGPEPEKVTYSTRQVLVRKPVRDAELPEASRRAMEAFSITRSSTDFWRQMPAPEAPFAKHRTDFELSFLSQRLPVYYCELTKNNRRPFQGAPAAEREE